MSLLPFSAPIVVLFMSSQKAPVEDSLTGCCEAKAIEASISCTVGTIRCNFGVACC